MRKFFQSKKNVYDELDHTYNDWDEEEYFSEDDQEEEFREQDEYDGPYMNDSEAEQDEYYAADGQEEYYARGENREEFYGDGGPGGEFSEEDGLYAEEDREVIYEEDMEYDPEEENDEPANSWGGRPRGYDGEEPSSEEAYYASEEDGIYYEEEGAAFEDERYTAQAPMKKAQKGKAKSRAKTARRKVNVFSDIWTWYLKMGTMDRIITSTGVAVLVLALVTGSVYVSASIIDRQVSGFVSVGKQLDGIDLIGEAGLLAVADAEIARIAAANAVGDAAEDEDEGEEGPDYKEEEFSKEVTVALSMTSIQKDLKIKFVNKKTGKLVANVPFSVSITSPDGKSTTWKDDDMDGIIYKKDIDPGKYTVAMNALEGEKYASLTINTSKEKVEVKKDIAYNKVDVSNEVKKESEVNASKEDTKKNENTVESSLNDTVSWVESTVTLNSYKEVAKTTIPDPTSLARAGSFAKTAYTGSVNPASKVLNVGEGFTVAAVCEGVNLGEVSWSSNNPGVASVDGTGKVTAVSAGTAQITFYANGSAVSGNEAVTGLTGVCNVTVNATLGKGTVTVDRADTAAAIGATVTVKATATGFTAGKEISYSAVSSKPEVATASIDANGNVTITGIAAGTAAITVKANYKEGGTDATAAAANINVTVTGKKTISLDKTTAVAYAGTPITINATIANAANPQTPVTAESSDTGIATASVNNKAVTITPVKAGTVNITVKYSENGEEVKAVCTVTVKANPREDKITKLKDAYGNQLFVAEGSEYREAVTADFYSAVKFFIKGEPKYTGWQTLNGKVYFFDGSGKKITGEQVIQGAKYNFASDGALVVGSGTTGIDVSKWNGNIDWNAVKNSGVSYVIIRCGYRGSSQGALIVDPKFQANIKGAIAADLKVGVYFFTQAVDEREAVEEASMVLDLVKNYKISYPIFLDVESSGGRADGISKEMRTSVCKAFCSTIQNAGYTAGIYANKSWFTSKIDAGQLSAYKIWLAQYAAAPTYKGRYDLWQYKSNGRVSGVSGNVDMNISYLGY